MCNFELERSCQNCVRSTRRMCSHTLLSRPDVIAESLTIASVTALCHLAEMTLTTGKAISRVHSYAKSSLTCCTQGRLIHRMSLLRAPLLQTTRAAARSRPGMRLSIPPPQRFLRKGPRRGTTQQLEPLSLLETATEAYGTYTKLLSAFYTIVWVGGALGSAVVGEWRSMVEMRRLTTFPGIFHLRQLPRGH